MNLIILFLFVLYSVTFCCSADKGDYRQVQACGVQYLKEKGKLNESIETEIPASPRCILLVPFVLQVEKSFHKDEFATSFLPKVAECLTDKYDKAGGSDYSIKAMVLGSLVSRYRNTVIEESKLLETEMKDMSDSIYDQCAADKNNITTIHNETIHQYEYCMAKYAIDNQLLELKDVNINPNRINTESVNCTNIIDAERREAENDYRDRMSAIESDHDSLDCAMNEFRRYNMFGWRVALKVLVFLISGPKPEVSKVGEKVNDFLSVPSSGC